MPGACLSAPGIRPLVCRKTERKRFPASGAAGVHPPGSCTAASASAVGDSMQGCRGRSPRRNKLWDSPFPGGGRGRLLVILCKGLRPLHPRGLNLWFVAKPKERDSRRVVPPGYTRRAPARRCLQVPQAIQCRGAGGEAPGEINFETPPSPEGEGG